MKRLLLLTLATASYADKWDDAEKKILRAEPSSFQQLPKDIVAQLEKKNCKISQTVPGNNVIQGEFAKKGQKDWAAVCSKEKNSWINIVWGGSVGCPEELQKANEKTYLQEANGGSIVYSRQIARARRAAGGYDGIEDVFLDKGSTIWTCKKGKWEAQEGSN